MSAQKERLYKDVAFLTTLRPYRNYKNLDSLQKVSNYIETEFSTIGLPVEIQKWKVGEQEYSNIIASYNVNKSKRLIIGAHYDVCGDQEGADDNASAIAGLLETSRLLAENMPELDYRIDLVAYCLEEPPFFGTAEMGSYVHAKSLHATNTDVIGMICYEMIGYFSDEPYSQPFPSDELAKLYPNTANFIIVVGISEYEAFNNRVYQLMKQNSAIDVQIINFAEKNTLASLSDQRNYWLFGYPALMINDTSFIRNKNYHQMTDTIDTLNFEKMRDVVNAAYKAVVGIV